MAAGLRLESPHGSRKNVSAAAVTKFSNCWRRIAVEFTSSINSNSTNRIFTGQGDCLANWRWAKKIRLYGRVIPCMLLMEIFQSQASEGGRGPRAAPQGRGNCLAAGLERWAISARRHGIPRRSLDMPRRFLHLLPALRNSDAQ